MLRLTFCFLITSFLFLVNITFDPRPVESFANLTRLTNTPEHALNLNPSLSDDGNVVVFESSADLAGVGGNSFHAIRAELGHAFAEIGETRAVCPALSSDGKIVAFASTEDLVGQNADRNSEIFLFDGEKLQQITHTEPASVASRLTDGNFQPSITFDGRTIAFSSNHREIFLYDTQTQRFTQLTNDVAAISPKISADGSRVYYIRPTADSADLVLIETSTLMARVIAANVPGLSITEGRASSNDGMRLVYSASTAPNQTQVFLFDARDNSIRQLTQLGSRSVDVNLQATISGDGRRIAFATRRRVTGGSDGGVELYVLDLSANEVQQVTNAPSAATAEVIASLNFDGSRVAFNFPRILSEPVSDDDLRNNSEIYVAAIAPRAVGVASVFNAAAFGSEGDPRLLAPGSIASIRGNALASVAGTSVTVNGRPAQIFYVSANEVVFVVPDGLPVGPVEFLVTNGDGLSSKAQAIISASAPGVFTVAGDGRGDAIVLNSDTLNAGPFDPSNGLLRLSIFATGVVR
ncbi:MAG TPA: IPT/TIG domain-containing protein, partial [Pyrinomonadaceae bacterium]|nr:IPT/TIG domain-containing protein [Pyrinomonadaceae bacterium]